MPMAPPPSADSDAHATRTSNGGGTTTSTSHSTSAPTAPQAYDQATRDANGFPDPAVARASTRVLILFSGPYARPDGLAAFLNKAGFEVEMLDNDPVTGGGAAGDILNDAVHNSLLKRVVAGEFLAIFAAPPCSTFSVSRFFEARGSSDGGPPPVRSRKHVRGLPNVPAAHNRELNTANAIVSRMAALLMAGFLVGTQFIVENPADRGDTAHPKLFLTADHGPIWLMDEIKALATHYTGRLVTFPMCAFEAPWQKYTSLMYSSGFDEWLSPLGNLTCDHSTHAKLAGGTVGANGTPSSETSAYPTNFNHYISLAVRSLRSSPSSSQPRLTSGDADGDETVDPAVPRVKVSHDPAMPSVPRPAPPQPAPPTTRPPFGGAHEEAAAGPPHHDAENGGDGDDEPEAASPPSPTPSTTRAKPSPSRSTQQQSGGREREGDLPLATRSRRPTLAPGLGNSRGWSVAKHGVASLCRALTVAAVVGASGFALYGQANLAKPSSDDPKTQAEAYAIDRDGWRASEQSELENHESNGSWVWIDRSEVPRGRALVKLVWVYKVKRTGKLKSRLCVQGCRQVPGVDYDQTWCGTLRGTSLRLLSAVAARTNMRMRRWDFVAAYLQGELQEGEVVYCLPPPGPGYSRIGADGREQVCKVVKPVYGMAQAGRRWQRSLFPWLAEQGCKQLDSDPSVFTLRRTMDTPSGPRDEIIHLGVYVDDLCVVYEHDDASSLYHQFTLALQERWKVEDEGEIVDLLGIEFVFGDDGTITLKQSTYIEKLFLNYITDNVNSSAQMNKTPCDDSLALHVVEAMSQQDASAIDPTLLKNYQSLVGALLYCSGNTRPDVAFAVGLLCRAMSKPTEQLYADAQRVLIYLHRHRHLGLRFEANHSPLRGQCDSDWGVRHSTSGWQFSYSSAVISWGSKKQNSVALSSCEAEIMAASEAAKEGVFLSRFLGELGLPPAGPVEMGMDNQAAIAISYNPEFHSRTKHIDRRHFYVRECVENMQLRVPFVKTTDNLADFFTKPLPSKHFFRMRDILMNVPESRANEHLTRDGEPRDDLEDDSPVDSRRRQRGPRKPRTDTRSGG